MNSRYPSKKSLMRCKQLRKTKTLKKLILAIGGLSLPCVAYAQSKESNISAIVTFLVFVGATLFVSYWASKKTRSNADFYTGGGKITARQNGLAIAGDFMSAASFLGISGLIFTIGFDGILLAVAALSGWPMMLFLMSERVRNLGRYTLTDVVSYRLKKRPIRLLATLSSISIILSYLIAQMVGAGKLIEVLFGFSYSSAVILVGVLVVIYVTFGGMLGTTWVQMIKAVLLLSGALIVCLLFLGKVDFSFNKLLAQAFEIHPLGRGILQPGSYFSDPIQSITLSVSMMFGVLGLPHILMRLFTVKDMQAARKSVFYASAWMGLFYVMTILIGFSAIVFVMGNPNYYSDGVLVGGINMVAVHLSHALGGNLLMGFMSAVAFSTILAVVAGLTVAGSAAISHDIYAEVICNGKPNQKVESYISRIVVVVLSLLSVGLGLLFEHENVAFIAVMPMVISASVNFPILLLAMYWRGFTTRGALSGGVVGFVIAIVLIILGPSVWVKALGFAQAIFPYDYPALFAMPAAFIVMYLVSLMDNSSTAVRDREQFAEQTIRSELG